MSFSQVFSHPQINPSVCFFLFFIFNPRADVENGHEQIYALPLLILEMIITVVWSRCDEDTKSELALTLHLIYLLYSGS